jgi:hypothetical protein
MQTTSGLLCCNHVGQQYMNTLECSNALRLLLFMPLLSRHLSYWIFPKQGRLDLEPIRSWDCQASVVRAARYILVMSIRPVVPSWRDKYIGAVRITSQVVPHLQVGLARAIGCHQQTACLVGPSHSCQSTQNQTNTQEAQNCRTQNSTHDTGMMLPQPQAVA